MKTFKTSIKIPFRNADPAGILYFANIFSYAHDCFEEFIEDCGVGWKNWFANTEQKYFVPIRHTEADFRIPFFPGQQYEVHVCLSKIGSSSFTMHYTFFSENGKALHATVKMTHTFADTKTKKKTLLPKTLHKHFEPYLNPEKYEYSR